MRSSGEFSRWPGKAVQEGYTKSSTNVLDYTFYLNKRCGVKANSSNGKIRIFNDSCACPSKNIVQCSEYKKRTERGPDAMEERQ